VWWRLSTWKHTCGNRVLVLTRSAVLIPADYGTAPGPGQLCGPCAVINHSGGGGARGWGADGDGGGGGGGGGGVRCGQAPNIRRRLTLRVARGGLRCLAAGSVGGGWEPVTPARADQMGASGGPGRPVPEGDPWGWDLRNPVVHANHTLCPRHSQTEHSPSRLQT